MPISIASVQNHLSDLLPYEPSDRKQKEITVCLKEYKLLTEALLETVQAFENTQLEKFDALVCENACEIRAIKVACIALKALKHLNINSDRILEVRNKIQDLLLANKSRPNYNANSLKDLLEKEDLEI